MDIVDHRGGSTGGMRWWTEVSKWRDPGQRRRGEEDEKLVEVQLRGKAPWGFTLRGGTEHREPLVITKVEEGSVAASVCLQAGDEMVSVNAVPLSGSRQEAICLVKSSHKTLTMVVRSTCTHQAKMVDIVSPRTVPSETEVHVARNLLTKILRSSMRKNDLGSRPHSWHSSKLTEVESEPVGNKATPAPVWQPKHEARSKDLSTRGDQNVQHQSNSVNNMERLDHPSHLYPQIRLSPTKHTSVTEPLSGAGGKREPGFSCSSPPVHHQSTFSRKGTSTENIFFKGLQGECLQQAGRLRYLQPTLVNGDWEGSQEKERPSSQVSISGRPSISPVWQVSEKKSQSSPPPPPLRSDSFAATKVFPYSEELSGPRKSHGRSTEKLAENDQHSLRSHPKKISEAKCSFNAFSSNEFLHPNTAADHNHNRLHPNKLFSLSSNDVRQPQYAQVSAHQRQYSDESPFYLQTRSAPATKTHSVGSYYRSLQDLPTNVFGRKHVRHSTASITRSAAKPNCGSSGHSRCNVPASKHSVQTAELQDWQGKTESWRGETGKPHWVNSNEPGFPCSLKGNVMANYSLPQSQMPYGENKEHNGHFLIGNGLYYDHQASEHSNCSCSPENATNRGEGHTNDITRQFPTHLMNDHKISIPRQQDPWVPQEDHRISPHETPLLHSLTQESRILAERQPQAMTMAVLPTQDTGENLSPSSGKINRRSDRYATTLRKEIQQKRAQLQKSRSAATLTCGDDDEVEEWRSTETSTSSGVCFSNTYKDHLKEAQARVLQATSFQRRDLEPFCPEVPVLKTSNGRIRGRKRFPLAKKTHSFSEPDKLDKVGVEGEPQTWCSGERKYFEAKPTFCRPLLKSNKGTNLKYDPDEISNLKERPPFEQPEQVHSSTDPNHLSPHVHKQNFLEQQRLETFTDYQATWNKQKTSPEAKIQGRYHSAENIVDAGTKEEPICIHEKSRSSPSAEFHTQSTPSSWREPPTQESSHNTSGKAENTLRYQPDRSSQSVPSVPRNEGPVLGLCDHGTKPNAASPSQTTLSLVPRSLSPKCGSQPPPRTHLGPETTSSSQEFLTGTQLKAAALQPLSSSSSDTQHHASGQVYSSAGSTPASSPHLSPTSVPDMIKGDVETEQEKEQLPPLSSSLCPFSSWTPALFIPTADSARSPSPQFAPLKLTDKPPAISVQDDSSLRSELKLNLAEVMDVKCPVRKVPVKIVRADSSSDQEGHAYLPQSSEIFSKFVPSPFIPSLGATEHPASSLFSAYTWQVAQDPGRALIVTQESILELSYTGARLLEEDAKREELARDIMGKDKSLVDILDQSGRKTTMDLMEGLFPPEEEILEGAQQRRRASSSSRVPPSSPRSVDRRAEDDVSVSAAASLVPSSSYYNTSAPKAELLIKMKGMQGQLEEQDSEDELDVDLASKKQELITSLARKLEVLREARQSLLEDVEGNETLGREVEATVQCLCQPNQLDKFRMFVGDLDKVVNLLLSLSGRLARVENALNSLEDNASPEEKHTLTEKRKLLMRQHEDAKELKENLDRRERLVSGIMQVHLDAESLEDYRHFVKMKSALIIEQRKLEDKIKLGEEQLKCLVDSLPLEQRALL